MAKDPAMLWYWGDWYSGTVLMSRFLKGCYMDLLHAQFNNGRLSLEEIKTCLGSDFGQAWPALRKKFKQDETELFFNERLEIEKTKRKNFVSSRSNGKSGRKKSHDISHDIHTNNHTDNENKNEIRNEVLYSIEHCAVVALNDDRWKKANKADEKRLLEFNAHLEKQGIYQHNPLEYKRYFHNWTKKQNDGTQQQSFGVNKRGTSEKRNGEVSDFVTG